MTLLEACGGDSLKALCTVDEGHAYNIYGIPDEALDRIRERDRTCVYCHKPMFLFGSKEPRTDWATIEHLDHLPPWDDPTTVAICCVSCNSSRGARLLPDWFGREYCVSRGISEESVAQPVRDFLERFAR
jgi:hypothetical protein